jgi:hypothetical protein
MAFTLIKQLHILYRPRTRPGPMAALCCCIPLFLAGHPNDREVLTIHHWTHGTLPQTVAGRRADKNAGTGSNVRHLQIHHYLSASRMYRSVTSANSFTHASNLGDSVAFGSLAAR